MSDADRKLRGAWYTPAELVDVVADGAVGAFGASGDGPAAVRVLDPACGDGRLLVAAAARLARRGMACELVGCDVDPAAVAAARAAGVGAFAADALTRDWGSERFDIVVGNPPFLSQMAATTTRGGASRHGGGPYADAAVEFLALAVRLARPGGSIGLVLPQSILGARDAGPVRAGVAAAADLAWSWWAPDQRHFDASVNVCVLGFVKSAAPGANAPWTRVVTDRLGIPGLDRAALRCTGTLGERAELNANFRDEYYALVPAVGDDADGPPLVTSGLIDPGACLWGRRAVRFAKRDFAHPRVDLARLTGRFPAWAARKLVPKVLVANQTRVVEAVADPEGAWLPGVPVATVTPLAGGAPAVWGHAAVLTSPVASVLAWHAVAGTGLSTSTIRLTPAVLGATPWPAGSLDAPVAALRAGDLAGCAAAVCAAYGLSAPDATALLDWWHANRPR